MNYDVFNGDADGLCAIRQLRLVKPLLTTPITGLKRDINLMARIQPGSSDCITVADISMDRNRQGLCAALQAGAHVSWFDHHFVGDPITHPNLDAHITHRSDMCSSLIVYHYLRQQGHRLAPGWALTGAFGDGLDQAALVFAKDQPAHEQLDHEELESLKELGVLMNYNSYGETLEDLHIHPQSLHTVMQQYVDPLHFIADEPCFDRLRRGYQDDLSRAVESKPYAVNQDAVIYILPDTPWSRRVSGVFGNHLMQLDPDRAQAVLFPLQTGGWRVSVRVPLNSRAGAGTLCRQFPTGGGREGSAGIDQLVDDMFEQFQRDFMSCTWGV